MELKELKESSMRGRLSSIFARAAVLATHVGLSLGLALGFGRGTAMAQPAGSAAAGSADAPAAAGSADAPAAAGSADAPAAGSADAGAGSGAAAADPAPTAASTQVTGDAPAEARAKCTAAMNADETLARSIIRTAIETDRVAVASICSDLDTVATHRSAVEHVEKNQRHVILAYAAMWVIAALFLLYLFGRQRRLKAEIAQLRRDLDEAAGEGSGKGAP